MKCFLVSLSLVLVVICHEGAGFVVRTPGVVRQSFSSHREPSLRPTSSTELYVIKRIARIFKRGRNKDKNAPSEPAQQTDSAAPSTDTTQDLPVAGATDATDAINTPKQQSTWVPSLRKPKESEKVSVCIVGGGVSGLAAAITCAQGLSKNADAKIVLLEASDDVGGRVRSDKTDDGFTLDRGFAVFIEEYPEAKKLLDYEALNLGKFLPGALVKVSSSRTSLARVADPLRQPAEIFAALLAPIGDIFDKIGVLSVVLNVRLKSIEELFEEQETSTKDALTKRWMFSNEILDRFFKPFLEGIYLAPIEEQSSRMFSFVFKMFSEGAATLPEGGIGSISKQLGDKVTKAGVDIRLDSPITTIEQEEKSFTVTTVNGDRITADSLVVATDGEVANKLISQVKGFESLGTLPSQVQRDVGNVYYSFKGEAPVTEPILILNGMGKERGTETNPVNNVCFPSAVTKGYAPEGYSLCSVTILKDAMDLYQGRDEELDAAVRKQLSTWFPDYKQDILESWELKRIYRIKNAQPGQFQGPFPANVNGARPSNTYRNKELPNGLFCCGDHMSTATLNGALESGVLAGSAAFKNVPKK